MQWWTAAEGDELEEELFNVFEGPTKNENYSDEQASKKKKFVKLWMARDLEFLSTTVLTEFFLFFFSWKQSIVEKISMVLRAASSSLTSVTSGAEPVVVVGGEKDSSVILRGRSDAQWTKYLLLSHSFISYICQKNVQVTMYWSSYLINYINERWKGNMF